MSQTLFRHYSAKSLEFSSSKLLTYNNFLQCRNTQTPYSLDLEQTSSLSKDAFIDYYFNLIEILYLMQRRNQLCLLCKSDRII